MSETCSYCGEEGHSIQNCPKWREKQVTTTTSLQNQEDIWRGVTYVEFDKNTGVTVIYVEGEPVSTRKFDNVIATKPTQSSAEAIHPLVRFMFQKGFAYVEDRTLMIEERI